MEISNVNCSSGIIFEIATNFSIFKENIYETLNTLTLKSTEWINPIQNKRLTKNIKK